MLFEIPTALIMKTTDFWGFFYFYFFNMVY